MQAKNTTQTTEKEEPRQLELDFSHGRPPRRCPRCNAKRVTAKHGVWACTHCGRGGSY